MYGGLGAFSEFFKPSAQSLIETIGETGNNHNGALTYILWRSRLGIVPN